MSGGTGARNATDATHYQFVTKETTMTTMTPEQERIIRAAHFAMDARCRGKQGIHTTTEACRIIRELLDILGDLTGIRSAVDVLPFDGAHA